MVIVILKKKLGCIYAEACFLEGDMSVTGKIATKGAADELDESIINFLENDLKGL